MCSEVPAVEHRLPDCASVCWMLQGEKGRASATATLLGGSDGEMGAREVRVGESESP